MLHCLQRPSHVLLKKRQVLKKLRNQIELERIREKLRNAFYRVKDLLARKTCSKGYRLLNQLKLNVRLVAFTSWDVPAPKSVRYPLTWTQDVNDLIWSTWISHSRVGRDQLELSRRGFFVMKHQCGNWNVFWLLAALSDFSLQVIKNKTSLQNYREHPWPTSVVPQQLSHSSRVNFAWKYRIQS